MNIPVIETERLILRAHRIEDFEALAAMWGDPLVARFIGGKPSTREESWARLLRYAGLWPLLGFGYWTVKLKDGTGFVGDVGLEHWHRDITPSRDGMPEGGWVLATPAQGRGLATEAVGAALAWFDRAFVGSATTCIVGEDNLASIQVAQKNGYREAARTQFKGSAVVLCRRSAAAAA